jgi:hypothetical protein
VIVIFKAKSCFKISNIEIIKLINSVFQQQKNQKFRMFLFRRSSLMATTVYGRSLAPISKHYFKQKNNNTYPESLNSLQ